MSGDEAEGASRGRRRLTRGLLVAGAVALVVVLVAVVAAVTMVSRGDKPEDVVRDYLEAVRRGDVDEALRIAGGEPGDLDRSTAVLDAAALSDEWEIQRIVRRYPGQDRQPVVVDVVVSLGDEVVGDGRFRLSEDEDGWRIDEPFAQIALSGPSLVTFIELNGLMVTLEEAGSHSFLAFPGVYRPFTSLNKITGSEQPVLVAMPGSARVLGHDLGLELASAGEEALQRAVNSYIDECAAKPLLKPPDCPFAAGSYVRDRVYVNQQVFEEVQDLAWEVVSYPDVTLAQAEWHGQVGLVTRRLGSVRLTGTGIWTRGDGEREAFSIRCGLDLSQLSVRLDADGEFRVAGREIGFGTCD